MDANEEKAAEVIERRLERLSLEVLKVSRPLLASADTHDLAKQLRRAASGAYGNYGAARAARTHADFTSKVGVAYEEADESRRWLRLLKSAGAIQGNFTDDLIKEAGELRAILYATHKTAKKNRDRYRRMGR